MPTATPAIIAPEPRRVGPRLAAAAIACAGLVAGVVELARIHRAGEVTALAAAIERGERLSPSRAASLASDPRLLAASRECGATSLAAVSLLLAVADAAPVRNRPSALVTAREAVENGLRCDPAAGNLWLRRAMVMAAAQGPSPDTFDSLDLSHRYAPAESWIIAARIAFARRLVEAGHGEYAAGLSRDLAALASRESARASPP
jgi:hypothetical protein